MAQKDPRSHQPADRVYIDFQPSYEWAQDEGSDTLILMLKGFRKENLRVKISATRMLKLSGEQQISENKWSRFRSEFTIPPHSDTNGIKAKLEGGLLYVRLPKGIKQVHRETTTPAPAAPNHEADDSEKPREDKSAEAKYENSEAPAATPTQKTQQEELKTSEVSQEKEHPSYQANHEMEKTEADNNNVVHDTAEATTSESQLMHEVPDKLGNGGNKIDSTRSATLYGLIMELGKQKKLVIIFIVLVIGLYVKNAIKSSFGGSNIQEL